MNHIVFHQRGAAGIVTLNRPEALNALSIEMLQALYAQLHLWQTDASIKLVIITSSSSRAFCAGGDVRQAVSEIQKAGGAPAQRYFQTEYGIHAMLPSLSKPILSLVDGVVMGGGLGLARNSGVMVVSETIKYAMPETAIGLFPDVGANIFLRQAGLSKALMLGMTGTIIGAGDVMAWGLADICVPASQFDALTTALSMISEPSDIQDILAGFSIAAPKPDLALSNSLIDEIFTGSLTKICGKLEQNTNQTTQTWREAMQARCPASIAAIHYLLSQPAPASLEMALNLDFKLALNMTGRPDFVEGVRAILIDKDNAPNWSPSQLAVVDAAFLQNLFDFDGLPDLQQLAVST